MKKDEKRWLTTDDTIVHILKGLENKPFLVRKKEQQIFYTKA